MTLSEAVSEAHDCLRDGYMLSEPALAGASGSACLICGRPVPDYVPEYCCNGFECGCHGQPRDPCVCSPECEDAVFSWIGESYETRRIRAGIPVFSPNTLLSESASHDKRNSWGVKHAAIDAAMEDSK